MVYTTAHVQRLASPHSRASLAPRRFWMQAAARLSDKTLQAPKQAPTVTQIAWKVPLEIVKYPDPRLRAMNAKVGVFDSNLLALAKEMIRIMYLDDGVGLAAPQVGINIRLMVFNPEGRDRPGNETILVNPEIVSISTTRSLAQEGCLSFPGIYSDVERPRDIVIKAQNEKGEPIQLELGGTEQGAWVSRIFQHEYDHLQGILFHDRMKANALDPIRPALVELEETFAKAHPNVKIQRVPAPKVFKGFGAK